MSTSAYSLLSIATLLEGRNNASDSKHVSPVLLRSVSSTLEATRRDKYVHGLHVTSLPPQSSVCLHAGEPFFVSLVPQLSVPSSALPVTPDRCRYAVDYFLILSGTMPPPQRREPFRAGYYSERVGSARVRCKEEVQMCYGMDPCTLRPGVDTTMDVNVFPEVTHGDIVNYLVYSSSFVEMKAFKSMEALKYFTSRRVRSLSAKVLLLGESFPALRPPAAAERSSAGVVGRGRPLDARSGAAVGLGADRPSARGAHRDEHRGRSAGRGPQRHHAAFQEHSGGRSPGSGCAAGAPSRGSPLAGRDAVCAGPHNRVATAVRESSEFRGTGQPLPSSYLRVQHVQRGRQRHAFSGARVGRLPARGGADGPRAEPGAVPAVRAPPAAVHLAPRGDARRERPRRVESSHSRLQGRRAPRRATGVAVSHLAGGSHQTALVPVCTHRVGGAERNAGRVRPVAGQRDAGAHPRPAADAACRGKLDAAALGGRREPSLDALRDSKVHIDPLDAVVRVSPGFLFAPFMVDDDVPPDGVNAGALGAAVGSLVAAFLDPMHGPLDGVSRSRVKYEPATASRYRKMLDCLRSRRSRQGPVIADDAEASQVLVKQLGVRIAYGAFEKMRNDSKAKSGNSTLMAELSELLGSAQRAFFAAHCFQFCQHEVPRNVAHATSGSFRCNAVLRDVEAFRKAFKCPAGSVMRPAHLCAI
ncbi:uncharacterized protein [Dermacentor albipictus]|uniref:uncharacterized protein isoform X2 n=1 Tax=Dermacentor albipictus TaxID=60249 RepID=UPI0038FCDCD9